MQIRDLFHPPSRFFRSAHLERDFDDEAALRDYILTPPVETALGRILDGLRPGSKRRAWRVTGDYGSGKSSFALVLAQLLRDPTNPALSHVRSGKLLADSSLGDRGLMPILITGSRGGVVQAAARGIIQALSRVHNKQGELLITEAKAVAKHGDAAGLVHLLERVTSFAVGDGMAGTVFVLDEMGQFLEFAALHPEREDVFVLQRLAEAAARSGDKPILLLALLHQGFHAYTERLPPAARHEWEKIAGRFEEIVFDQPLVHTKSLVAGALGVRREHLPAEIGRSAEAVAKSAIETGWLGTDAAALDPAEHYPLHPTVLPVVSRFFGRHGQNERSLFGFLLSSEPFGLQSWAEREVGANAWFRLPDLYDYIRAVFGYRLTGTGQRSQWTRLLETMDGVRGVDPRELRILKCVALLNLLDAEDLAPTDATLEAVLNERGVRSALERLVARRLLHPRGSTRSYYLWPTTSVNLDVAYRQGEKALGPLTAVAPHLPPFLPSQPLQARRHYIASGTLRYFEVRYATVDMLDAALDRASTADGLVLVALCDDGPGLAQALGFAGGAEASMREEVIVAVPQPLAGLAADLQEARVWQWVVDNTPELAHDEYGAAEARRQLQAARARLNDRLESFVSFGGGRAARDIAWLRRGIRISVDGERGLRAALSAVCEDLFPDAPLIRNELLNRRQLSSAAAAARMRLVELMLTAPEQPSLGMPEGKWPPEKSMYLSVLAAGGLHREENGRFMLGIPPERLDNLRLRPALRAILEQLESAGDRRVPVPELTTHLCARPRGVREGVIPLLLGFILAAHGHEIAVYENGTFVQRFGPAEFLRLTKLPGAFEVQLCRITGVRSEVFEHLVALVGSSPEGRDAEVLDVVGPLCRFAAELPPYTRQSKDLSQGAIDVRDALMNAREPGTLLFRDLPLACGFAPFDLVEGGRGLSAQEFAEALRHALDELRGAYPALLERLRRRLLSSLDQGAAATRAELARAAQVALAIREPRLRSFAYRLADERLGEEAWVEAMASVVMAKPPSRWIPGDEARCGDELDVLGATFQRMQAIHFSSDAPEAAVRITLTHADGEEDARVIDLGQNLVEVGLERVAKVRGALPEEPRQRLAVLAQLLQEILAAGPAASPERVG